ncbi:MAG: alpha-D-ribose 1-methylphosphonate 5-triphosphate diphosphatase [Rhodospirillaceae bacterium]|nr:alpha-D-ribose 1-methylphosphonate 5-triphosphate diphosphatase [Rhodospirillaceae bacterium]
MTLRIDGARVLLPDHGLAETAVTLADGRIAAIGAGGGGRALDAAGLLLLPGVVDLHGDAFERQLMPRPGVVFPIDAALVDTDRQLVANGVTTALHGLTWSWEPGLRGREAARNFLDALNRLRPVLAADNRVHLRYEIYNTDAAAEIGEWLAAGLIDLLAFNDHLPMFLRRVGQPSRLVQYAERAGMGVEDFIALLHRVAEREPLVGPANRRLAETARLCGVPLASHDDETPAMRRHFHDLGCALCEFPVDSITARAARDMGDGVIMGAPNVLRGRSHTEGGMRAADLAAAGLVDALASDYYYPALPLAPFRLVRDGVLPLERAWDLVSSGPARLAGLADRGAIAKGLRADLVLIDDSMPALPRVIATIVAGRVVHAVRDMMR